MSERKIKDYKLVSREALVRKAISLTVNTIVIIVLAVAVFAIALIMLFTAQKGGNTILSVGRFYVSDANQLFEAKKQCQTLCQWAKTSGDFLDSKYCNYQVSLKLVDSQTGETVEKLFYCWQKPISVYCEDLQEIAGQYIHYYYVDPTEGCKDFTIDSYQFVAWAQQFANDLLYSPLNELLKKKVDNAETLLNYLALKGVLPVKEGVEIKFNNNKIKIDPTSLTFEKELPPTQLIELKDYISLSCSFIPEAKVIEGKLSDNNGPIEVPGFTIKDNNEEKFVGIIIGNVELRFIYDEKSYTAYYPLIVNFIVEESQLRAFENKEILRLVTSRIGAVICDYLTS
jgi:hypothetical protein